MTTQKSIQKPKQKLGPWQKAWLASLESGEHRQAKEALTIYKDGKFSHCCLGLACEVLITNGLNFQIDYYNYTIKLEYKYNSESSSAPKLVVDTIRLHDGAGNFKYLSRLSESRRHYFRENYGTYDSLIDMNDGSPIFDKILTFKKIAKFIRLFPELVFSETA